MKCQEGKESRQSNQHGEGPEQGAWGVCGRPSRCQPGVRSSQFGASTLAYRLTCPQAPT